MIINHQDKLELDGNTEGAKYFPPYVSATDRVFVKYRDGNQSKIRVAGGLRWEWIDLPDDIMEYRVANA